MTRPEAVTPALAARLKARGRGLLVQPLLHIKPLPAEIPAPENFQAVLAGSIAAVRILAKRTEDRSCRVYVVGKSTSRAAEKAGYSHVRLALSANELAAMIWKELDPSDGPLLYVAGRHRARDLRRLLSAFELELIEVYAAEKTPTLRPAVCQALKRGQVSEITFYSARAVNAFMVAARRDGVADEARKATGLCLSPRIAARLRAHGWRQTWAARHPIARLIDARLIGIRGNDHSAVRNSPSPPVNLSVDVSANFASSSPSSFPSPAQTAVPEASMTSPPPTPSTPGGPPPTPPTPDGPAGGGRSAPGPGWPAVIAVAIIAAIFAGVVWYLANDRAAELQAEVSDLRDRIAALNLDPGQADRAALAARAEEAAKVATALSGVAEKAAEKATVERLADRVNSINQDLQATIDTMRNNTEGAIAGVREQTEGAIAEVREQTEAAIAGLRETTKNTAESVQTSIQSLKSESEAQRRSVDELSGKLTALEQRLEKVEEWTKGPSPAVLAEQLIALSELRQVLDKGTPFATALDRAEQALPDVATASGDWMNRAETGIPTYAELAAELAKIEKRLPPPQSDSSGNAVVDSALGVLLSGIQVEGKGALVDHPNRKAIAAAREALANDNPEGAYEAVAAVADDVKGLADWRADLAARMQAEAAISDREEQVLATVRGSVK